MFLLWYKCACIFVWVPAGESTTLCQGLNKSWTLIYCRAVFWISWHFCRAFSLSGFQCVSAAIPLCPFKNKITCDPPLSFSTPICLCYLSFDATVPVFTLTPSLQTHSLYIFMDRSQAELDDSVKTEEWQRCHLHKPHQCLPGSDWCYQL